VLPENGSLQAFFRCMLGLLALENREKRPLENRQAIKEKGG
jgi:hypothetical protein